MAPLDQPSNSTSYSKHVDALQPLTTTQQMHKLNQSMINSYAKGWWILMWARSKPWSLSSAFSCFIHTYVTGWKQMKNVKLIIFKILHETKYNRREIKRLTVYILFIYFIYWIQPCCVKCKLKQNAVRCKSFEIMSSQMHKLPMLCVLMHPHSPSWMQDFELCTDNKSDGAFPL